MKTSFSQDFFFFFLRPEKLFLAAASKWFVASMLGWGLHNQPSQTFRSLSLLITHPPIIYTHTHIFCPRKKNKWKTFFFLWYGGSAIVHTHSRLQSKKKSYFREKMFTTERERERPTHYCPIIQWGTSALHTQEHQVGVVSSQLLHVLLYYAGVHIVETIEGEEG